MGKVHVSLVCESHMPVSSALLPFCCCVGVRFKPMTSTNPCTVGCWTQYSVRDAAIIPLFDFMQGALVEFENIVAMEPRNFVGDSGARNTPIYKVALYNVACCYSMLDQVNICSNMLLAQLV